MRRIKLRWWIFTLLLLVNMVNYFDRQVFSLVAPTLQHEMGWREVDYGRMVAAFQVTFALSNLFLGRFVDVLGARLSMTASILWFSIAQVAHALVRGTGGFLAARVGLALGEAPVYPATLKAVAEWAPKDERSVGAGMVHFGVSAGAVIAPLIIPWMTAYWGWQSGFLLTGALGFLVLIPWLMVFHAPERHPRISAEERAHILASRSVSGPGETLNWLALFRHRQLWACVAVQAMVNPAWWFLTYWLPKFMGTAFDIRGVAMTPYVTAVYAMAAGGALLGGSLSGVLIHRGFSLNAARKLTMLGCGLAMPLVIVAAYTRSPWLAVLLIGMAAIVHQTWVTTGAAVFADLFPPRAIASVVGIGSFFGSLAGVVGAEATGRILQADAGNYAPMFIFSGFAYLAALGVIHLLVPRMEPVREV